MNNQINELDFSRSMDFKVKGDIEPTVTEVLGHYHTHMGSDCDVHLEDTNISLPAYWHYLTFWGFYGGQLKENGEKVIRVLYEKGLIEFYDYH